MEEATQDYAQEHWRSVMDNAQLAVENAAKAVLALVGPVGRTHFPAPLLREVVDDNLVPQPQHQSVLRLATLAEYLGIDVHIQTDYGDEVAGLTPWELFDKEDAEQALAMAGEAVSLARQIGHAIINGS
ncbi:MAG: HEPN domain-containing protein [Chloroflexi bacterium]|nr:HEPN domain-containing protein [Chloroflexota bacterium]